MEEAIMMMQEFEVLTGRKVSADLYENIIEPMYYNYQSEDKIAFCEYFNLCFKDMCEDKIRAIAHLTTDGLKEKLQEARIDLSDERDKVQFMADAIFDEAMRGNEGAKKAYIEAAGMKEYLLAKVSSALTTEELQNLNKLMKDE